MRTILLMLFSCFFWNVGNTQKVLVTEEPSITELMNRYLTKNRSESSVKGWRIQIITTPDRRKMQKAEAMFNSLYPRIKINWQHVPPYYKVVVGAWKEKLACDAFLVELKEHFPTAIPVIDNIQKRELVN